MFPMNNQVNMEMKYLDTKDSKTCPLFYIATYDLYLQFVYIKYN